MALVYKGGAVLAHIPLAMAYRIAEPDPLEHLNYSFNYGHNLHTGEGYGYGLAHESYGVGYAKGHGFGAQIGNHLGSGQSDSVGYDNGSGPIKDTW
jgi:hypothetical protein